MRVVGVDGCPGGWVAAVVDGDRVSWRLFGAFDDVVAAAAGAALGVDMPVGPLPGPGERRRSDVAARAFLGAARSSVFWTPGAGVVARWRADPAHPLGAGVSVQSWNLIGKIVEVADSGIRPLEVHPECSFRAMAPGVGFDSKKTAVGAAQRVAALRTWCDVPATTSGRGVFEDALDATAVAWTVARWARGQAVTLPPDPVPGEPVITV